MPCSPLPYIWSVSRANNFVISPGMPTPSLPSEGPGALRFPRIQSSFKRFRFPSGGMSAAKSMSKSASVVRCIPRRSVTTGVSNALSFRPGGQSQLTSFKKCTIDDGEAKAWQKSSKYGSSLAVPRHSMCRKTPEATRRVISREKEPKKKKT